MNIKLQQKNGYLIIDKIKKKKKAYWLKNIIFKLV